MSLGRAMAKRAELKMMECPEKEIPPRTYMNGCSEITATRESANIADRMRYIITRQVHGHLVPGMT